MTFVEPKAVRGQFVEWWASRRTDCNEIPEIFAELRGRNFDALTSYKRFLLTPFLHTPSV